MAASDPTPTLTYFDIEGRGEMTRLCFRWGNIAFNDERLAFPDFAARKASLPFGSVPVMTLGDDTFEYAQHVAIARYAAKRAGLYPEDFADALYCDMAVDAFQCDLTAPAVGTYFAQGEEKQAQVDAARGGYLPVKLAKLESMVKGEWFLGDQPSLADMAAAVNVRFLGQVYGEDVFGPCPNLRRIAEAVRARTDASS